MTGRRIAMYHWCRKCMSARCSMVHTDPARPCRACQCVERSIHDEEVNYLREKVARGWATT